MSYTPHAVANWFLGKGPISQMKLHKLVYFAHGWNLGLYDEPLIREEIEAWKYGPVVSSLYREFKEFGAKPIPRPAARWSVQKAKRVIPRIPDTDEVTHRLLARIWKIYGHKTGPQLSAITHQPNSPWEITRRENPDVDDPGIPNRLIREHFRKLAARNAA